MAIEVDVHVEIRRPKADVVAFIEDCANDPRWVGGVHSAELVTPGPLGVGSRVRRQADVLGRKVTMELEVVDYAAGERIVWAANRPFEIRVQDEFTDLGDRTRLRLRLSADPGRLGGLVGGLAKRTLGKGMQADLERLKALLEGG